MRKFLSAKILLSSILVIFSMQSGASGPHNWQMRFQDPASPVMEQINSFHDFVLYIITAVVIFVLCLLAYTCIRFRKSRNPIPSTRSHNILLEIIWTIIPVIILVIIAFPSINILYFMEKKFDPDLTLKVVGHQWYWEYEYPDHQFSFDSYIIKDKDLQPWQPRLLEVDNRVIVPVGAKVKVLITSYDVIHSWAVPALGIKTDAVPGRINETWFQITKPGVYYGQCSEICGIGHGFMPIAVEAVSKEEFDEWVLRHKEPTKDPKKEGKDVAKKAA
jgi:cytochrome c oxidase subunit 2